MSEGWEDERGDTQEEGDAASIIIKVVPSLGEKVFFKIRRSTKFSKVQKIYASKVGKDVSSIRFLYNGAQINDNETPSSLEMEDNDTIDVMVEQVGEAASHRP
ncbi:ubiquitin-related domain-containing protein [Mycena polygramma]|nr:ubiquitin-related domain-containing protein [Mycena polygramma]